MTNLEEVVRERNRAYFMLETGTTGERPGAEEENFLGLPEYNQFNEYPVPKHENKDFLKAKSEEPVVHPSEKRWFLTRLSEKRSKQRKYDRVYEEYNFRIRMQITFVFNVFFIVEWQERKLNESLKSFQMLIEILSEKDIQILMLNE